MNTPRLFLAATILFWGWQTGQWLVAAPLALAFEGAHAARRRWDFSTADFSRAADLCTVIVLAVGVVLYVAFGNPNAVKFWFQWLAVMLLPLALLQAWGTSPNMELSALVWSLRRVRGLRPIRFNVGFPYAAIWILGASSANPRGPLFYAGIVALTAWALGSIRPRSAPIVAWFAWPVLVATAASLGFAGHVGLNSLQVWLEGNVPEWLVGGGERTDPYESRTDLGRIGEIKGSSAILLRVRPEGAMPRPLLLHRASYDDYVGGTWIARAPAFTVIPRADAASWRLGESAGVASRIVIDDNSRRGNPVLSLPHGTIRIDGLAAVELRRNPMDAVQAELGPGPFRYMVGYDPQAAVSPDMQAAPRDMDLRLPRSEVRAVEEVARSLGLGSRAPAEAMAKVSSHFRQEFRYALYQRERPAGQIPGQTPGPTPIAHFLLNSHEGHCEYFATATVLLLRAAGVPARYATGFSVQEYSARENAHVVRQRHAHAWARAWVNGRWVDLDTTPPDWFAAEAADDSAWTALSDLWSWLRHRWNRVTEEMDRTDGAILGTVAALLLAAWFAWRLMRGREDASRKQVAAAAARSPRPGADSEFYLIESRLAGSGWVRPSSEALSDWLDRVARHGMPGLDVGEAREALQLHYRYRFDPEGITGQDRDQLRRLARRIVEALDQAPGASSGARSSPR